MNRKPYPTDLTDAEWQIAAPLVARKSKVGAPTALDIREVLNAIFYLVDNGIKWRAMPHDFPDWHAVYYYFKKWRDDGTLAELNLQLAQLVRVQESHDPEPSMVILDSQSVKTTEQRGSVCGYDKGKQVKGRKRFLLVDTLGLLVGGLVTAANVGERAGGQELLRAVHEYEHRRIETVLADQGYNVQPMQDYVGFSFVVLVR